MMSGPLPAYAICWSMVSSMADHAIVIGIQVYPGLQNLQGPCNDAEAFRDWLLDPNGGGLDLDNIKMALTTEFDAPSGVDDAHPTTVDLEKLFREHVTAAARQQHVGERLFVFVAGHGFADSQDMQSAALFTANAEFFYPLHMAIMCYVDFLHRAWAFDELIVIMDSCRSTNPMYEVAKPALPRISPHANSSRVKRFIGFGAAFSKVAREREFEGSYRGIFSTALLDALRNAKPNQLGRVTGTIVKKYIHNGIRKYAENVDPEIDAREDKDVLFVRRAVSDIPVEFRVDVTRYGRDLVVLFGGRDEIHRITVSSSPLIVSLEPGLYVAKLEGTQQSVAFEVPVDEAVTI